MRKIIFLTILLFISIYLTFVNNDVILTDDLSTGFVCNYINDFKLSYTDFISKYTSTPNMTSRPISSAIFYTIIYLMKFNEKFYYLNYLFFLISIIIIFFTVKKIFSENISVIITIFYSLIPIGTSIVYSPIMMNSNIATIFYGLSLFFIYGRRNLFLSIIFLFFSVLSYEIFAPLIIFNAFLVSNNFKIRFIYFLVFIMCFILYKKIIEPYFFPNYIAREKLDYVFNFKRNLMLIYLSFRMIFYDVPKALFKSVLAIKYYSLTDYLTLIVYIVTSNYIVFKCQFNLDLPSKKVLRYSIIGLLVCFLIYPFSFYDPTLYGFNNRTLGGIRLFFSIVVVLLLFSFLYNKNYSSQFPLKLVLSFCFIFFSISTISIKNAWHFSDEYNKKLFMNLSFHLNKNLRSNFIFILNRDEELKKDKYILNEPIFLEHWESSALKKYSQIPSNFDIYYFHNYQKKFPEKYYIYNNTENKLYFVNNN